MPEARTKRKGNLLPYVFTGIAALVATTLFAQKRAAGYLQFFVQGVAVAFDGITPVLKVNLAIQNPSNQRFVIKSLVAELTANGSTIGNVSSFQTVNVAPNSQMILPILIRLSLLAVAMDIVNLIQTRSGVSQQIKLKGAVNANDMLIPLELDYKIL